MQFSKKYLTPLLILLIFEAIAVSLWLSLENIFYLFNFSYIGVCISVGIFLYIRKFRYARNVVMFSVGLYVLVYLGIISHENMQIEGFWYFLFLGVFQAAVIHYAVAKIFGPLLFGRGWCGYACWTAMILDVLPFKVPSAPRKKIGYIKYIVFAVSLIFVTSLFIFKAADIENIMWISFIVGNILYYAVGIYLAFMFKDNRAFCKYICPVAVILKLTSYFSLTRVRYEPKNCLSCGKCLRVCPMDVDMMNNSRSRVNGTECILCMKCVDECPRDCLKISALIQK
ncbi:MAG: 4Fe-4S dicluster domain-containing protein [Methanocorpusculum sp.]|nr:4Fe-4S dicluster domain-containing protein [Methanocorpusculum sp.]